jgi:LmbE family N-acetylglucosaminyl deacetylase
MATMVCFHAHPDDECLSTGGTIARASAEGHRVVLVVATNGEHGQVPSDLAPDETLVARRRNELQASADVLKIERVEWLGYADSGMTNWEQNSFPGAFINADTEHAATKLAKILIEENAEILTVYDWHGNYGHPDHIKVHHVGHRAAQLAGTPQVYEMTTNRDFFRQLRDRFRADPQLVAGVEGMSDFDPDAPADDGNPLGEPESVITHKVDVTSFCEQKLRAIACHASQVTDTTFFTSMDPDIFRVAFGTEWFIKVGESGPPRERWLFE